MDAVVHEESNPVLDQGCLLLRSFCADGSKPPKGSKDYGRFVKELLKYRLLDVAAFVFEVGGCPPLQPRGNLRDATVQKLVYPSIARWRLNHDTDNIASHQLSRTGQLFCTARN
jgi:hypothetical protein